MASTYVNDLRLNEMATGDGSGTWGTTTNTNLELIAEAFSYGTEVITTNADTHTTTIADGATDPGRSLYLKYTGTLDSACTITIGPNTVSKVWIVENGTSGSQNIILSQGSGANITIPAGDTKVVYSDGAGAGAAFFDAFASLSVVDLKVQDDLTVTGDITGTLATAAQGNITSLGTLTALQVDNININGNTISSTAGTDLNITPLAGQQIVLDGAIVIDAGVVTGATSITSTAFVGNLTGNVTGNTSGTAATVTGAAQTNITSLGTLSALTVTGEITANGGIALGDNDKATFGASDDLEIYHDGSNSYIKDVGTGTLNLQGATLSFNCKCYNR
jgi:hypothetical protein